MSFLEDIGVIDVGTSDLTYDIDEKHTINYSRQGDLRTVTVTVDTCLLYSFERGAIGTPEYSDIPLVENTTMLAEGISDAVNRGETTFDPSSVGAVRTEFSSDYGGLPPKISQKLSKLGRCNRILLPSGIDSKVGMIKLGYEFRSRPSENTATPGSSAAGIDSAVAALSIALGYTTAPATNDGGTTNLS
ncbi:hypothetical protein IAT40_004749 [Kwoniella sp. CBS 6097]